MELLNKSDLQLGSNRSVIRDLFEYGLKKAEAIGKENVYDYSLGNPTVPIPDCVKAAMEEIAAIENSSSVHGYTVAQGDESVRAAIAADLNQRYGLDLHADHFYLTCGAAASLCICFHALTEGQKDEFIAIAPYFPEYKVFVEAAGARFRVVAPDTEKFQVNWEALEATVNQNTKGVIVNSPNNPSGAVYGEATIVKLCAILKAKAKEFGHPIVIVADEPYREIVYGDTEVPCLMKYYENTLICYSYSKSLSLPGDRIGYIIVPEAFYESRRAYAAISGAARRLGYVCAPSFFQKVIQKCVGQTADMRIYQANRDLLYGALTKIGYDCVLPEGAFYLFVKTLGKDPKAFCEKAKALNLLVVDGEGFGCPGYVRIAYCVDKAMIAWSLPAFRELANSFK